MRDVYETIETFGLCEDPDDLPIPNDDELRDKLVRETFEALIGGLNGTMLHSEVEHFAHGLATLFHRRQQAMTDRLDRAKDKIKALVRCADGSEVLEVQLDQTRIQAERAFDRLLGLDVMAEAAAHFYEVETGRAYMPPTGERSGRDARLTGALFEARAWIEAHEKMEAERYKIEGRPLAVAGDRGWMDHARVWDVLDRSKARYQGTHGEGLILYHKGDRKGLDAIASAWARKRNVPQVLFRPNWAAFGKRAGFKAIDDMFATPKRLGGVAIFGTSGIALNLADKAEERRIPVLRVK